MASSGGSKGSAKPQPAAPLPIQWVCVELSPNGEKERSIPTIVRSVHHILNRNDLEVFVPAISEKVRGESQTMVFLDGYIFVRYEENVSYIKLQDTAFFKSVLCQMVNVAGQRKYKYSLLEDAALEPLRDGVQSLRLGHENYAVGQRVKVVKGEFKNLPGEISEVYDEKMVQVAVRLLSKLILIDFPVSYLTKVS